MILLILLNLQLSFFSASKITWTTPTEHSFGEILRGGEATHIFNFKNISTETITLDNVRTDCGCTATEWEATPILPNKLGRIKVNFDASRAGVFRKKITVWVRGQRKPERLVIEGTVLEN
jgi:Protein of unknown function (DUF1573)